MQVIYTPRGRAREYSPLALNIYNGCDHGCIYCYIPKIYHIDRNNYINSINPKTQVLQKIEKDAKKLQYCNEQVLLSFAGDPYNKTDQDLRITREALKILLEYNIPVSILTKGGERCLRDLDLFKDFKDHIKVGASLTFIIDEDSIKYEPGAALPNDRLETLKTLHDNGIKTWISFEPVIKPQQTINLLDISLDFVDEYRIGKINHYPELEKQIYWPKFLIQALEILRMENKQIYVKKDLRELCKSIKLNDNEIDMDLYLAPPFIKPTDNRNYGIKMGIV